MANKEIEERFTNINPTQFRKKLKEVGAELISKRRVTPLIVFFHPKNKKDSYI